MLLGDWAPWVLEALGAAAELLCARVLWLGHVPLVPLLWQCAAQQLAPSRSLSTTVQWLCAFPPTHSKALGSCSSVAAEQKVHFVVEVLPS